MTDDAVSALSTDPLTDEDFAALDAILDDLRTRDDEIPQWEFCEGFLAALVCCRRVMAPAEYLPVLLGIDPDEAAPPGVFADEDQFQRFTSLWLRRWFEVATALQADVASFDDERAYQPEVMDLRAAISTLTPEQRVDMGGAPVPSFGQIWAIGFMYAVESWPEEWAEPRDREAAKMVDAALQCMVALTEDDTHPLTVPGSDEGGEPSMSQQRLNDFANAIWAVYDLSDIWRSLGPRVDIVRRVATPGRNDPCSCGSGKKYKKCCGA